MIKIKSKTKNMSEMIRVIPKKIGQKSTIFRYRATAILYIFLILTLLYYYKQDVFAQSAATATDNSNQQIIEDKQDQIEDLQKKAENYRQMIEMKQDKAQTLENQLKLMEGEISSLENDISGLQKEIDQTSSDIDQLNDQIKSKEEDISQKKKVLSGIIQNYYENSQGSLTDFMLRGTNLSDFLSQPDYISQTGTKVDEVLTSVTSARDELEGDKKSLEIKNNKQKENQGKVLEKKRYLDGEQDSKQQLLEQTNGEEEKYQQLLARVEEQKQELLGDISSLSEEKSSDLAAVEATIEKPKSGLASTSWYFSQRDSRWGNQHIGLSNTLMKNYGCAVTAVAMVLRYHGADIDPGSLAQQQIFSHDLIVWPKQWKGIELASSTGHGNIDWDVVDRELKNKNPVIVFVKSTKRGAGHYVVVHGKDKNGDYIVHDPYWGSNLFLSSTKAYVGALYGSGTVVDQMIIYH
ncbi:MAG: C39 family peptidase [Parcubacteria group bacterium]|jgi:peptidoglycan hydrolase CwlO-like protein